MEAFFCMSMWYNEWQCQSMHVKFWVRSTYIYILIYMGTHMNIFLKCYMSKLTLIICVDKEKIKVHVTKLIHYLLILNKFSDSNIVI